MDDPVADISDIIHNLTQGDSKTQQQTLEQYFTHDASFKHPFCAVSGNRQAILRIFQWYKILSPHIELEIESIAYDRQNLTLYITLHQIFSIWFIPFHHSPVTLTTVLHLARGQNLNLAAPKNSSSPLKYYITSQNDLYQVDQFVRFFAPWGLGITIVALWHWIATLFCIIGARLLQPLQPTFVELSRPLTGRGTPGPSPRTRRMIRGHVQDIDEVLKKIEGPGGREDEEREELMNS